MKFAVLVNYLGVNAMTDAFKKGKLLRSQGFSIAYNPYRHKGSVREYQDFILGWNS